MIYWISVGSNLDPERWIVKAAEYVFSIFSRPQSSNLYITKPIGRPEQADYRNAVWAVESSLPENEVEKELKRVEQLCERNRITGDSYASRTLDLDLIGCNELFYQEAEIRERAFLRRALLDLKPEWHNWPLMESTAGKDKWNRDMDLTEKVREIFQKQ